MSIDQVYGEELHRLRHENLDRRLPGSLPADVINFSSNDYLGLSCHPTVLDVARNACTRRLGARAARLIGADYDEHRRLEKRIASFKGGEAGLLFSSGYQANIGVITAMVDRHDAIFCDLLNHASIFDGCRLSRAKLFIYPHLDLDALGRKLAAASDYRRRLVVTDSVFGMDGDHAPLAEIAKLAKRYDAMFYVDEAHATGIYGDRGAGLCQAQGVKPDVQLATFGKALGSFGAAVVSSETLIEYLVTRARTFIYTTALPPAVCAATNAAIDIVDSDEGKQRREQLMKNCHFLAQQLATLRSDQEWKSDAVVQPFLVGSPEEALALSEQLLQRGLYVQAIRPPTVPQGKSRLRISVNCEHTAEQISALINALKDFSHT